MEPVNYISTGSKVLADLKNSYANITDNIKLYAECLLNLDFNKKSQEIAVCYRYTKENYTHMYVQILFILVFKIDNEK